MKILVIENLFLVEELRSLGHEVHSAGHDKKFKFDTHIPSLLTYDELLKLVNFDPDLVFYCDKSEVLRVTGLEYSNIPTVFYSIDTHIHGSWHCVYGGAFDTVLVAQKDHLPYFQKHNSSAFWFPLWAKDVITPKEDKDIEVCFRGVLDPNINPKRKPFFEKLSKIVPVDYAVGPYDEAYARAKIVVNHILNDDLNFRFFEALMCGALLVTPEVSNGFLDIFTPGENLVTYIENNVSDVAKKIKYYLEHDDERIRIAEAGRKLVLEQHTSLHRARTLEAIFKETKTTPSVTRLAFSALTYLKFAREYHQFVVEDFEERKSFDLVSDEFLFSGARNLFDFLAAGCPITDDFTAACCSCIEQLTESRHDDILNTLLSALKTRQDISELFWISVLSHLHNIGLPETASQIAKKTATNPDKLLKEARIYSGCRKN